MKTIALIIILLFAAGSANTQETRQDDKNLVVYGCATQQQRIYFTACKLYDPETGKRYIVVHTNGIGGIATVQMDK